MIKLIVLVLTLNTGLILCKDCLPNEISELLLAGNHSEALNKLIKSTEERTLNVIQALNCKLIISKVAGKIFDLLLYIDFNFKSSTGFSTELDPTLTRIFTTMFQHLVARGEIHSYTMIELCAHAKMTNGHFHYRSKNVTYLNLFEKLANNKFPSAIKTLVWGDELKCVQNKKFGKNLYQSDTSLNIGDIRRTRFRDDQRWRFDYMLGIRSFYVRNFGRNRAIEEIFSYPDGVAIGNRPVGMRNDDHILFWRIQLINDVEFFIINPETRTKLYAVEWLNDDGISREARLTRKGEDANVWYFAKCYL